MSKLVHHHFIYKGHVKDPLQTEEEGIAWTLRLIEKINMKLAAGPIAKYVEVEGNRGLTCAACIETSHIAFHIWDEQSPALLQLDVYSCSCFNEEDILSLVSEMNPEDFTYKVVDREIWLETNNEDVGNFSAQ